MDPVALALQLVFDALFAVSAWQFIRRRGPIELSVMAIFGSFVALFLISFLNALRPELADTFGRPAAVAVLYAQPYLVVRLVDQIRPTDRRISWLVLAGGVLAWAAVIVLPQAAPQLRVAGILAGATYFFVVELGSAARIGLESRRRFGVARLRLGMAAAGTALFGASILLLGLASAANNGTGVNQTVVIATRLISIAAGLAYVGAFMPPRGLRRFINQAAAFRLVRNLVAPQDQDATRHLWADLAATARDILGARRVSIIPATSGAALAVTPAAALAAAAAPISTIELPVRSDRLSSERIVAEIEGRALFVDDDLALLGELAALTARAMDRESALVNLAEARREADESRAIRASEARFRALLEAAPDAILALDEDARVTWATRQAGELFGRPADALSGVPLGDLVVILKDETPTATVDDRPVYRAETTGRRADGTHFPAEVARTTFELDGRPFQIAVISDVTWRHEADQIRDRFLGVLSHELRTPVTSIYGGTQLILGRGARLDEETRNELLVSVAAEAERLQRMIENLVAMARIERGAEFGGTRPVLIDRIIRQLVERERALWPEVSIRLVSKGPVQMVAADEEYLAQIMRNLLSNAAKYSGPGSSVEVSLEDGEDEVIVRVVDNGPGIAPDDADRLFGLYYRAAQQASVASGAGIGLFVCRELVAVMGGRIWARPRPEGGAEFGFTLPAYVDELDPVTLPDGALPPMEDAPVAVGVARNGAGSAANHGTGGPGMAPGTSTEAGATA